MATTIVSNLAVFADATGSGNQSHLVYASNQARWWLFVTKTKTATVVSAYVSSSNDLTTATWAASTDSPVFPSTNNLQATDQRQLGVIGFANGTTDVVHVSVGINNSTVATNRVNHIRATFTGASAITWESWAEYNSTNGSAGPAVIGNVLGGDHGGTIHETSCMLSADFSNGYPTSRLSTNADTTATWTTGFGAVANPDSQPNFISSYALATLATGNMLLVYGNGGAAQPNTTGLRYNKYSGGTTWPTTSSAVTGNGTTSQDQNDWCLCDVDDTHQYIIRRSGTNTFDWRKFDGSSTMSSPANGVPNQNHLAGSGMFAVPDGQGNFYLFLIDSAANGPIQYVKCTSANGTTPTWGAWTQLEAAGSSARNYISGYPVVGNNQIGIIFTAVNGTNFDIVVTVLSIASPPPVVTFAVSAASSLDNSALTTGAFTPAASDLLVAFVDVSGQTGGGTFTDSQNLGWTVIQTAIGNSADSTVMAVANTFAAAVSTTVTFTPAGAPTATGAAIVVLRVSNMFRTGANAVRQSVTQVNQLGGSGAQSCAFPMQTLTTNPTLSGVGIAGTPLSSATSGWTVAALNVNYTIPSGGISVCFRSTGFAGTPMTPWVSQPVSNWSGIGAELNAATLVPVDWQLDPSGAPANPVWNLTV